MAGPPGAVQRLPLADLQAAVIAPAISPLPTAVALIAHVFRGALPELRGRGRHRRGRPCRAPGGAVAARGGRPGALAPCLRPGAATGVGGALAELLHGVPSMASHHLRALERAGLVDRVREGRTVIVRRTARGDDLIALYREPDARS